jgi:hypothetical protein
MLNMAAPENKKTGLLYLFGNPVINRISDLYRSVALVPAFKVETLFDRYAILQC